MPRPDAVSYRSFRAARSAPLPSQSTASFEHTRLPNGLTVISRHLPGARSVALGLWLVNGGRHQAPSQAGFAHLLEHLLFKGHNTLDALELARRFEAMGGQINAHTGRELTALHGLVPAGDAVELLGHFIGMLLSPRFDQQDVEIERDVVVQEMSTLDDTPEEALEEAGIGLAWPWNPLGWPILGRRAVLEQATAIQMHEYISGLLTGGRICVAAVGGMEHERLVAACSPLAELPQGAVPEPPAPRFVVGAHRKRREINQAHMIWVMPAPSITDPRYPALLIANHLLGGGVSSRLFQEVRERRGLVYNIHSRLELYSDAGLWIIQTAADTQRAAETRRAVDLSIRHMLRHGIDEEELSNSRDFMRSSFLLTADHLEDEMDRLAREAIYYGTPPSTEDRLAQLAQVTADEVVEHIKEASAQVLFLEWGA